MTTFVTIDRCNYERLEWLREECSLVQRKADLIVTERADFVPYSRVKQMISLLEHSAGKPWQTLHLWVQEASDWFLSLVCAVMKLDLFRHIHLERNSAA